MLRIFKKRKHRQQQTQYNNQIHKLKCKHQMMI